MSEKEEKNSSAAEHHYKQKFNFDFVGKRKIFAVLSTILCIISLFLFIVVKPSMGIDFSGGTELHLKFKQDITADTIRTSIEKSFSDVNVQKVGDTQSNEYLVRIKTAEEDTNKWSTELSNILNSAFGGDFIEEISVRSEVNIRAVITYKGEVKSIEQIEEQLKSYKNAKVSPTKDRKTFTVEFPGQGETLKKEIVSKIDAPFEVAKTDSVGPKVGSELRQQGLISILATLGLILVYVAARFNVSFAPGAVLALLHDVLIVVGIFIILDNLQKSMGESFPVPLPPLEFNLPMIGALLTIIGYSLNDTIVIYDRIRENMSRYRKKDLPSLINTSINETLHRTVNTSLTTLFAMSAFLFFGSAVIQTFALAIILGVIVGTYSTIYVASPTILIMQEVQPWLSKIFAPAAQEKSAK